jgi:hypothetical protein
MAREGYSIQNIVLVVLGLIVMGLLLPMGLTYIGKAGDVETTINGSAVALSDAVDPAVITLLTILLPIMVVIGIIMAYIPRRS